MANTGSSESIASTMLAAHGAIGTTTTLGLETCSERYGGGGAEVQEGSSRGIGDYDTSVTAVADVHIADDAGVADKS